MAPADHNEVTPPATPRPAATLLLVRDDPFEVLMVRRSAHGSFPSAVVFPGGTVDPADGDEEWLPLLDGAEGLSVEDRAVRIAAIRETFEEVGLFLGVDADGRAVCPAACDVADFRALVAASGARLALGALVPFARWITPEAQARRWDTHFFVARAPAGQVAVCDDVETMAPEWLSPAAALDEGGRRLVFPTRLNLMRLGESCDCEEALATARARPLFSVLPWTEERADGVYWRIADAAGYSISEVRLPPAKVSPPAA